MEESGQTPGFIETFILSNDIIDTLLSLMEDKIKGYTLVSQNFLIQYTYFEFENGKWLMKNFLDIGNEKLKNIHLYLDCDHTNISVYGQNPKYGILNIKNKLDMRNKSKPGKIYACDLYDNFEPLHYCGKCYTSKQIKN